MEANCLYELTENVQFYAIPSLVWQCCDLVLLKLNFTLLKALRVSCSHHALSHPWTAFNKKGPEPLEALLAWCSHKLPFPICWLQLLEWVFAVIATPLPSSLSSVCFVLKLVHLAALSSATSEWCWARDSDVSFERTSKIWQAFMTWILG